MPVRDTGLSSSFVDIVCKRVDRAVYKVSDSNVVTGLHVLLDGARHVRGCIAFVAAYSLRLCRALMQKSDNACRRVAATGHNSYVIPVAVTNADIRWISVMRFGVAKPPRVFFISGMPSPSMCFPSCIKLRRDEPLPGSKELASSIVEDRLIGGYMASIPELWLGCARFSDFELHKLAESDVDAMPALITKPGLNSNSLARVLLDYVDVTIPKMPEAFDVACSHRLEHNNQ